MHPHEEATRLAKEKLQHAEKALADYVRGAEVDDERRRQLAQAVVSARRELLDLHPGLYK